MKAAEKYWSYKAEIAALLAVAFEAGARCASSTSNDETGFMPASQPSTPNDE